MSAFVRIRNKLGILFYEYYIGKEICVYSIFSSARGGWVSERKWYTFSIFPYEASCLQNKVVCVALQRAEKWCGSVPVPLVMHHVIF